MNEDPDATVRLRLANAGPEAAPPQASPAASPTAGAAPPAAPSGAPPDRGPAGGTLRLVSVAVAAGLVVGLASLWLGLRDPLPPVEPRGAVVATPALPPRPVEPPADPGPPLLAEAEILAHRAEAPALLRLAANPRVFVLDFPDLASQGAALNRVAALIEKAGLPRDRLLTDVELVAAIARSRDTPETWYYGHDYRGSDLARFFALAERDGIALNPLESWVRTQLARARRLVPEDEIALISIAAPGPRVSEAMRAAILRHEIGHGHYFTLPAYTAHVRLVWRDGFTEAERAAFRRFLAGEGYDPDDEDLMINEAQAYLIHTPDQQFFNAGHVRLPEEQVERLRRLLLTDAPLP